MTKETKKKIGPNKAIAQLKSWNEKLGKQLILEKYQKMSVSSFIFYRGSNHLFWSYFANDKRLLLFGNENTRTWVQGDLHVYNYGIYQNDQEQLVYDLNDFDESCIADYQFDVWRMAASIILIAEENKFFDPSKITQFVRSFTNSYLDIIRQHLKAPETIPDDYTIDIAYGKLDEVMEEVQKKQNRKEMLKKWALAKDKDQDVFDYNNPKLRKISPEQYQEIEKAMLAYRETLTDDSAFSDDYFNILDIAERVTSGTGSYGTPRYYLLIKGTGNAFGKHRILDVKLQKRPTPYHFFDSAQSDQYNARFMNEGRRHATAYIAKSQHTDNHLGWLHLSEDVFSVRERSPYKAYFPTKILDSETRFSKMAEQWGKILAMNHVRAYKKFDAKEIISKIEHEKQTFAEVVSEVAFEYVAFNKKVYRKFMNRFFLNED